MVPAVEQLLDQQPAGCTACSYHKDCHLCSSVLKCVARYNDGDEETGELALEDQIKGSVRSPEDSRNWRADQEVERRGREVFGICTATATTRVATC